MQAQKKKEEQAAVEEADNELTNELFSGISEPPAPEPEAVKAQTKKTEPAPMAENEFDRGGYDFDMMGDSGDEEEPPSKETKQNKKAEPESKATATAAAAATTSTTATATTTLTVGDISDALEKVDLKDDKDYKALAKKVVTRLKSASNNDSRKQLVFLNDSRKQLVFLKEFTTLLTESWKSEEFNSFNQAVNVIANNKKKDNTAKKKKKGGATLKTDKAGGAKSYDDYSYDEYGDFV
eukprot:g29788.t1